MKKLLGNHSEALQDIKGGGMARWFRALDLKSGGPWFKSSSLPLDGFVLGGPRVNSSKLVNSQLVSLPPVGIFNKILFNLQYLFAYFSVPS